MMNEEIKNFIENNIGLIEYNKWKEIYEKDFPVGFTESLLEAGINPLEWGLNYIPNKFLSKSNIREFTIPNNVTSIDDEAFSDCKQLKSIEISDSVISIGEYAFYECSGLTEVTIGNSVKRIGKSAFRYCLSLTSVNYTGTIDQWVQIEFADSSSNLICYARNLYINNELVREVVLTTATKINDYAFCNCDSLTSIEIGDRVTSIGDYAFSDCTSLTSVTIGKGVTSIGNNAFLYCKLLTTIKYIGTKREWDIISKGFRWREGIESIKIICTDGVIEL